MPTIHDVAKKAGVAPITVSRVINNSGYISDETRERVEAAIAELGYVPNTLARSLRSKRTNTLALVLTDITNPFFTTLARGVEDAASDAGYTVIFCNTDESMTEEQKYLRLLLQKQVDGFLLVPARSTADSVELIQKHGTPLVVLDRHIKNAKVDIVRGDSERGAYDLVKLLLSLGHRKIAALAGPKGVSTAEDRINGYRRAMLEAGIPEDQLQINFGGYTHASGFELAQQVLNSPDRPTAIFAGNNFITLGAMKAVQEAGLSIPEEMALVGFDDLPPFMVTFPFLTVVAQPAYEMGQQATRLLLSRLMDERSEKYQEIVLPPKLIIRASSGTALQP